MYWDPAPSIPYPRGLGLECLFFFPFFFFNLSLFVAERADAKRKT